MTAYDVHRSTTSGFTPSLATLIASPAGTSYSDLGLANGTYYYKVVARDAVGNTSGASAQAAATIGAVPVVLTLSPTADAYGNAGAPSSNYGTSASLASRGTSGYASYLRFVLPAAPAGTTLTGASLGIRTSTDATAGSTDVQTLSLASDTLERVDPHVVRTARRDRARARDAVRRHRGEHAVRRAAVDRRARRAAGRQHHAGGDQHRAPTRSGSGRRTSRPWRRARRSRSPSRRAADPPTRRLRRRRPGCRQRRAARASPCRGRRRPTTPG